MKKLSAINKVIFLFRIIIAQSQIEYFYHNHNNVTDILTDFATKYPTKTYLYSIGKSVLGILLGIYYSENNVILVLE